MSRQDKVLVTGATGFIASHLVRGLVDLGVGVIATGRPSANTTRLSDVMSRIQYEPVDLRDPSSRQGLFDSARIVGVYHLATEGVHSSIQRESDMLSVNVVATVELARLALAAEVDHFVHVGSGFEFESRDLPIDESAPVTPSNFYGATKGAAALILNELATEAGLPLIIFRPFSVYGPGETTSRFVPYVITQALRNQPMNLTRCTQVRDYLYVTDVVAALLSVLKSKITYGTSYNLGGGVESAVPIRQIVEAILELTGCPANLARFNVAQRGRTEPSYFVADATKASRELGWQPQVPLSEGLARTVAWYRQ